MFQCLLNALFLQCSQLRTPTHQISVRGNRVVVIMDNKSTLVSFIILICLTLASDSQDREPSSKLVVNGTFARIEDFPYFVSLRTYSSPSDRSILSTCGGSILNKYWILTTTHCIVTDEGTAQSAKIIAGIDMVTQYGDVYDVDHYVCHPNYDRPSVRHDLCLLKLSEPVLFSYKVKVVRLATVQDEAAHTALKVAGFGLDGINQIVLRLSVIHMQIHKTNTEIGSEPEEEICLKALGKSAYIGDAGSGMVARTDNGPFILFGVISTGDPVHEDYTFTCGPRMTFYASWINDTINKA